MSIAIKKIEQVDDRTLGLQWTDGKAQKLDVVALRRHCPCAVCVDEKTGRRLLKPEQVPETVRPLRIDSVGTYALSIRFSDGHGTGIYTFDNLRRIPG